MIRILQQAFLLFSLSWSCISAAALRRRSARNGNFPNLKQDQVPDRRVVVWYGPDRPTEEEEVSLSQLKMNSSLFDAVYAAGCGIDVNTSDPLVPRLVVNATEYDQKCGKLRDAVLETGHELQMWLSPSISRKIMPLGKAVAQVDVSELVASSVALAQEYGWSGINYDDEQQGCPRQDPEELGSWLSAVDKWATGMHEHKLTLSVDVQFLTCSVAKEKKKLELYPELCDKFAKTAVAEWIEMDTYVGGLDYFYDNLDFYTACMPKDTLGIGMLPNAHPQDRDRNLARFYAIDKSEARMIGIFRMPVQDEEFLKMLRKWKTRCAGCVDAGVLSCWESGASLAAVEPDCI